ncbi:MAG: UPF0145 protein TM_0763 [Olavius algarvensis Delta 4 endosymbiont]|nr:MAG: UPF0145 protein TM_0763 [Olavius algarvensis Delta 4 endosymbiont]
MSAFNVVFKGEVLPGQDINAVKKQLSKVMRTDAQAIERLFTGTPVVVRKAVDEATGRKFEKVFAAAGAVCYLEPLGTSSSESPPVSSPDSPSADWAHISPQATTIMNVDGGKMILTNVEIVPGKTIVEHFGLVSGSTIRAKHVGRDIMASLKNIVGGELKGYTQLLKESRRQATERMIEQARELGANAIVNVRFSTSSVAQGAAELYAYGTAVRVK